MPLNLEVAAKPSPTRRHRILSVANRMQHCHQPVTAPGILPGYADAGKLVTADCIQPLAP